MPFPAILPPPPLALSDNVIALAIFAGLVLSMGAVYGMLYLLYGRPSRSESKPRRSSSIS